MLKIASKWKVICEMWNAFAFYEVIKARGSSNLDRHIERTVDYACAKCQVIVYTTFL